MSLVYTTVEYHDEEKKDEKTIFYYKLLWNKPILWIMNYNISYMNYYENKLILLIDYPFYQLDTST